jgi:hypothetical protein
LRYKKYVSIRLTSPSQTPYSSKLITLNLLLVSAAETSLVDKLGKLLLNEFVDLGDSSLEARLARARNVEVQRRFLWPVRIIIA